MKRDGDEPGSPAVVDFDALNAALAAPPAPVAPVPAVVADSEGRSSATYSSARPHAIPPTRRPQDDPNAPAVIIAPDDTIETPAAQVTVPWPRGPSHISLPPLRGSSPEPMGTIPMRPRAGDGATLRMSDRPRRRHDTATVTVHSRGPTKQQKLLVFLAMLVVVVAGGVSALVYYDSSLFGVRRGPRTAPTATAATKRGALR